MTKPQLQLVAHDGQIIPIGGAAYLDDNQPVTVVAIHRPMDDYDAGSVTIRHIYGATEDVTPGRLGVGIDA
jgi:hypothetical protein